jgi:hypothetical protein
MSGNVALVGGPDGNIEVRYIKLCTACVYDGDGSYYQGYIGGMVGICERCGINTGEEIYDHKANDPRLTGFGPSEATACVTVDLYPRFIWDVNRYYARLGVDPHATKRDLKEAYQRADGQSSPSLTYIIKQLLDDDFRLYYDSRPLGKLVIDDEIVAVLVAAETERVARDLAAGLIDFEDAVGLGGRIRQDAYEDQLPDDSVLDSGSDEEKDRPVRPGRWAWGYYACRSGNKDFERLAQWQGALAAAIAEREEGLKFAVGFLGHSDVAWEVTVIGYRVVAFLNDSEHPQEQYVAEAASRVVQLTAGGS